jgi:thiol:disulfide interchange protein
LVESGESQAKAKTQALAYTAGVLASFFVLGLILLSIKSAGNNFSWGMQLQNPVIVLTLAALMLAMGLNLSGVFSFGHGLAGVGAKLTEDSGAKGAFFSGVLACIVATPCTGPFMFTALGYAFTQSNAVAMLVLMALGLGLALPFLLIGLVPSLAKALPKPGAWMESLKQWLAFPLYASAIWLMNVFAHQSNTDASSYAWFALLLLAAGLWWWDRQRFNEGAGLARVFAAVVVLASVVFGVYALNLRESEEGTVAFSESAIQDALNQQRVVFVDMTAAWCVTCKVNERTSINTREVGKVMQELNVVYMVGDYTNADPAISAYLKRFGAVGVPLYVVYSKSGKTEVLPQVLSPGIVTEALRRASAQP